MNSNTQLYKQAGNSICVPVIEYIIIALLECGAFINERKNKEMELRINEVKLPEKITFNYEEIKTALLEKVQHYETLVYDEGQIKDAKTDRANLNKLKKALNDERIRQEEEYMQPFNEFKAQIKELVGIVDNAVSGIDSQVKAYEEKCKAEKLEEITNYFNALSKPFEFELSKIFNEKWLNASVKMTAICDEIYSRIEKIEADLVTLKNLPDFSFEAIEEYKQTLDLNRAIAEGQRLVDIQKRKAEAERARIAQEQAKKAEEAQRQAEIPPTPEKPLNAPENVLKQRIRFECLLTTEDAVALREFFLSRNIEFKAI